MRDTRPGVHWHGPWKYRLRYALLAAKTSAQVATRRARHGPLLADWSYGLEYAVEFLRRNTRQVLSLPTMSAQREYLDTVASLSPALAQITILPGKEMPIPARWFIPHQLAYSGVVLFFHGGGYAYYARGYDDLIARVALAAGAKTLALDYPLAPEHPFPAALQAGVAAYQYLLSRGLPPRQLVLAGDSAGGNLVLTTLLALREAGSPMPTLAVGLSPGTDLTNSGSSTSTNARYDWIEAAMAQRWAEWFCAGADPRQPLISPVYADLRGLPPLYLQAGGVEILLDTIRAFADKARAQGLAVELEVWPNMVHDFQIFGTSVAQSAAAWERLSEVFQRTFEVSAAPPSKGSRLG